MDISKVAKDDANLVSFSSSFHNFAPRCENAFWLVHVLSYPGYQTLSKRKFSFRESLVPRVVLSRGICKFVSVERRMR